MSVEAAVLRDLKALPADVAMSGLAEAALTLARELDGDATATAKANCARALTEILERLRALAPAEKEADRVDDLAGRRAKRIAGKSKSSRKPAS